MIKKNNTIGLMKTFQNGYNSDYGMTDEKSLEQCKKIGYIDKIQFLLYILCG